MKDSMDYRQGNHRTKKRGAKGSKPKSHEYLDGQALLKQMQKEKAEASNANAPKK